MYTDSINEQSQQLTPPQKRLVESIHSLYHVYQRIDSSSNRLEESLASGRMSDFLFEADEKAVVKTAQEAIDGAKENLKELETAGKALNSKAIEKVTIELRNKLAEIELDTGAFSSLKDFAGFTIKQITSIANGIAQADNDIRVSVDTMMSALDTLQIDVEKPEVADKKISEMIEAESERTKVDSKKFMDAIKKKLQASAKGGNPISNMFKSIMGMFKKSLPIKIDSNLFADELTDCTPKQIAAYRNGPVAEDDPKGEAEAVRKNLQGLGTQAGIQDPKTIAQASPPGGSPGSGNTKKVKKPDAITALTKSFEEMESKYPGVKNFANTIAKRIVDDTGLEDLFSESLTRRMPIHRMKLTRLLFEDMNPDVAVKIQKIVNSVINPKEFPDAADEIIVRTIKYFADQKAVTPADAKAVVSDVSADVISNVANDQGGDSPSIPVKRDTWPTEMGLPKAMRSNDQDLTKIAGYVNNRAGKKILETGLHSDEILVERWNKLAGIKGDER